MKTDDIVISKTDVLAWLKEMGACAPAINKIRRMPIASDAQAILEGMPPHFVAWLIMDKFGDWVGADGIRYIECYGRFSCRNADFGCGCAPHRNAARGRWPFSRVLRALIGELPEDGR